jgi:hypothetical protein
MQDETFSFRGQAWKRLKKKQGCYFGAYHYFNNGNRVLLCVYHCAG